jgi:hypothetical protein
MLNFLLASPSEFNENTCGAFDQFISIFGTDVLKIATFGCKFQYRHFTGKGKLDVMVEADVNANADLDFLAFLEASGAIRANGSVASNNYLSISESHSSCFGGGTGCPTGNSSFSEWLQLCPSEPAFIKGQFQSIGALLRDPDVAASFEKARINHFNRAFLRDEFIPLLTKLVEVINGPIGLHDTGGHCVTPDSCPVWHCPPDDNGWKPSACRTGYSGCSNPRFGSTSELNSMIKTVQTNISAWSSAVQGLQDQAHSALKSNIVSNATVSILSAEFLLYMSRVQQSLQLQSCGWTEQRCYCEYIIMFVSWQCKHSQSPAKNTQRTISYISTLA